MPETDARAVWQSAFERVNSRRKVLNLVVVVFGQVPLMVAFLAGLFFLLRFLPHNMHFSIRFGIGVGGGGGGAAMLRALLASIPGFGWAKELKRISDAVEPYQHYLDWLDGKDRAL